MLQNSTLRHRKRSKNGPEVPFPYYLTSIVEPNAFWHKWKSLFLEILNKHAPLRKKKIRSRPAPWMTREIKDNMLQRNYLKKIANKSGDPSDWSRYKTARNKVHLSIYKEN